MKIKNRTATYQTKNINVRVNPILYNLLETMAKNNDITKSDLIRSILGERFMQSQKTKRKN